MSELYYTSLTQIAKDLQAKKVSVSEVCEACLRRIEATESVLGALLYYNGEEVLQKAKELDAKGPNGDQPLWGVPITVKDLLLTRGMPTTAGSKMLEHFMPTYDAYAVEKLKNAGAIILAKANLDEFAMGSTTKNSAYHEAHNPWDPNRVPGGSSGGSAVSVSAGQCFGSLGTDTGGSIRQPACLCGCVGMKPSYGRVSRYGVIAYASSLDQVGPMARSVEDCARLLDVIAGWDNRDVTCSPLPKPDYLHFGEPSLRGIKLGIPREFFDQGMQREVREGCEAALKRVEGLGVECIEVSLPHTKAAIATYYIIAMAEASSNLARYDGVRFGYRSKNVQDLCDLYVASRSEGLGREVKRRIMLGAFVLSQGYYDAYYRKAAQVRRIIRDEYNKALEQCDALFAPVSPMTAWPLDSVRDDPLAMYLLDAYTLSLNLAGLPGLSLPVGLGAESGLPIGMQVITRDFEEDKLLKIAYALEQALPKIGHPKL